MKGRRRQNRAYQAGKYWRLCQSRQPLMLLQLREGVKRREIDTPMLRSKPIIRDDLDRMHTWRRRDVGKTCPSLDRRRRSAAILHFLPL